MAFFQSMGPAGLRLASFDFGFVQNMTLLEHNSEVLSWYGTQGGALTILGRGFAPVLDGNQVIDVTQGTFETLTLHRGTTDLQISEWKISASAFYDLVKVEDWTGLARLMMSGDDVVMGTAVKDVVNSGAGNDFLSGAAGNDKLLAGAAADILQGGAGDDTLGGGGGHDVFYFDLAPKAGGVDTILDFEHRGDMFAINHLVFPNVGPVGGMTNHWFYTGDPAREGRQGIIYDQETGEIFSDADGIGSADPVLFARVDPGMGLTASDFFVY